MHHSGAHVTPLPCLTNLENRCGKEAAAAAPGHHERTEEEEGWQQ